MTTVNISPGINTICYQGYLHFHHKKNCNIEVTFTPGPKIVDIILTTELTHEYISTIQEQDVTWYLQKCDPSAQLPLTK